MNLEQGRLMENYGRHGADRIPRHVMEAAISWVRQGELCRHYGPALVIIYSIAAAIEAGALQVVEPDGAPDR